LEMRYLFFFFFCLERGASHLQLALAKLHSTIAVLAAPDAPNEDTAYQ
jgi:hypothetical protein